MAETKIKAEKPKTVKIKLPRLPGANANQDQYVAVNGKAYIIQRGKEVEVPVAVANVLELSALAEEMTAVYAEEVTLKEPKK